MTGRSIALFALAGAVALAECGTACVCDLAWIVGRDEKLVSHHARALRAAATANPASA